MTIAHLFLVLAFALGSYAAAAKSADEWLSQAIALAAAGRIDEAEDALLHGRSAFARDGRFPAELAGIAWRKRQPARARAYLRESLRLDPASPYANEFLGSLYLLDGNVFAALKYWNRIGRPVVGEVVFTPEPPIRPELLARLPAVSAGQLLTPARLAQTERNLERLGIFTTPQFALAPARNDEYALTVRSQTPSTLLSGAMGRLLPLLRGLPYEQVNLDWPNIDDRAVSVTSLWRWDSNKRRVAVRHSAPMLNSAYSVWTDLRDEDWDLSWRGVALDPVAVKSASVGGEFEFELGGGKRWTPGVRLSRHTFRNGGSEAWFANSTVWEVRNRFDVPRWRFPDRRLHIDASATARTGRVFSRAPSRLVGVEFDAALHWLPQATLDDYSLHARVRATALSGRPPVDALYITGMERDNDLWLRGHVGTRDGRKGSAPMGTRLVLAQTEVARRLFRIPFVRIDAGPFLDAANVGGAKGFGSRGWLYDAGAQVMLTTVGGFRVTLIYGRDLRDGRNVFYTAVSR